MASDPNCIRTFGPNEIVLDGTNTIELCELNPGLPDKWETNNPDINFIGGSSIKKVSRTSSTPTLNRSGGIT